MFLGGAFLIGSPPDVSRAEVMLSFLLMAAGWACAFVALRMSRRPPYIFLSALFIQVGLLLFLNAIGAMPVRLSGAWPLISVFSGVALLPAGWHRYGTVRPSYVVLSTAFMVLGSVLLIFSLKIVDFSFSQFVLERWPFLVITAGLVIVLAALSSRITEDMKKRSGGKRGLP